MSAFQDTWFKSSYSGAHNNTCVEARFVVQGIDIRDSKDPNGPILSFDTTNWTEFINAASAQRFDTRT